MARPTARPSTTTPPRATRDDRELARLAIAGDGEAFAELYDRHERRVYGYCLRMLGTPDEAADATQETFVRLLKRLPALEGRDVNFVAYALTTARNACYDAIEARRRVQPVAEQLEPGADEPREIGLDPERAALLAATREDIRAANARLPERQREVLALRELEQLSYEQIGAVVGLNDNAVAQLISRARVRLRTEIRGDALGSIAPSSPDCERALPLLARLQDAQKSTTDELDWLTTHMASCETCRLGRAAMEEAGASYRALGPIVVLAWLRHATIAHAAQFVGADWSHLAGSAHPVPVSSAQSAGTGPAGTRAVSHAQSMAAGREAVGGWMRATGGRLRTRRVGGSSDGRRRRWLLAGAMGVCVLAILAVALAGSVTPDARVVPRRLMLDPRAITTAPVDRRSSARVFKPAVGRARAAASAANELHTRGGAGALSAGARPPGVQAITPAPTTHRDRRTRSGKAVHGSHPATPAPANGTSTPQPASTTPAATTPTTTATTPAPSPPSSGSGGSTGSGSGTSTGSGETTPPAETPAGSPGGEPAKTTTGCTLAIAC